MNKVALRVRYPPDYQPEEEPVRLPLGLFNDLLQELQNISTRYLPSNQEFDPTSIALELKVRDKASPSGLKEAGKQKAETGIEDDENKTAVEDEKSKESRVEAKTAGGNDPASPKNSLKNLSNKSQLDYALDKALFQTQPSETRNPNQEAKNDQASFRTSALQMRYLTNYQGNEDAPFTAVTQEGVSNVSNAEKETELDSRPPSRLPTETESAPSTPFIPSIPKKPTFPKIPGEIRMSESRWAKENVSSKSRKPRKAGQNPRYGRGGSLSGGHSPASSRQGSIVSLPQSQEENWNRKHRRAQESSDWGDAWGSASIAEGAKQLEDGWGTDFGLAENPQAQIDGNGWGSVTAPAAVHRERGAKEISHDWGAKSGNDDYSHSRPAHGGRGARGAYGGNQEYGRLKTEFDEKSSDCNSPSVQKHGEENNDRGTGASPQTKYNKNEARDDWASTGPADLFAPRSARGGRGDGGGDYQRGGRVGPRGRGSWNGVAQSAYNRSTEVKAGIGPADWGQENTEPSWGDNSNFAAPSEAENSVWGQDLHGSDWGQPDVSKNPQDAGSPSSPAQDLGSTWNNTPGWQPSRFKKHEPKW